MSDPIRDALRVAGEAAREAYEFDEDHRGIAAAAVAAFLRATPIGLPTAGSPTPYRFASAEQRDAWAAAVERAARGDA